MAAQREEIEVAGVRLTSPDKVLYPEQGTTKRGLAEYYLAVAEAMLPHVARRPITLVRCPTGRQKKCFYQRHAGSGVPAELGLVEVSGFEQSGAYLYIKDKQGLVAMVQMGVLEVHPWGATIDRTDRPDQVVFDLDPGEGLGFPNVVAAAKDLRRVLEDLGLQSFVKTTGGTGLHGRPDRATARVGDGEEFRPATGGETVRRAAGALPVEDLDRGASRAHLHRLPTQRPHLDRRRALFHALASGRAGRDPVGVG